MFARNDVVVPSPRKFTVNYKLTWESLRYAITIFSSETVIFFMQLHLPYFCWDSSQYAFAAFKILKGGKRPPPPRFQPY